MSILRYTAVAVPALVIVLGIFQLMCSLVAFGSEVSLKEIPTTKIDFVRLKREAQIQEEEEQLPLRPVQNEAPQVPDFSLPSSAGNPDSMALKITMPAIQEVKPNVKISGGPRLAAVASDTGVVPLVRVQPMYPPSAAQQRIEGWVELKFSVGKTGSVKDAVVIAAHPRDVFDRAALMAIRKWKYQPKIENGVRVETTGVKVRLAFKLEDMR